MIIKEDTIDIGEIDLKNCMNINDSCSIFKNSIFFDLEHYIYKKPICIGVFGCCYFDEPSSSLKVTQYMIENKNDSVKILHLAKNYFKNMQSKDKTYIVTFSGNNDFTIINYLFEKYAIDYKILDNFHHIDLQKKYEEIKKSSIGLKALEKEFSIERDSEIISGQTLAKTFSKIMKDNEYFKRMPKEKKEKILLYNEQDVISLFYIFTTWQKFLGSVSTVH